MKQWLGGLFSGEEEEGIRVDPCLMNMVDVAVVIPRHFQVAGDPSTCPLEEWPRESVCPSPGPALHSPLQTR